MKASRSRRTAQPRRGLPWGAFCVSAQARASLNLEEFVARRAGTLDPVLAELRLELRDRLPAMPAIPQRDIDRRKQARVEVARPATLRVGMLSVPGIAYDVGAGGLFLRSHVLVETGERGQIEVTGVDPVAVRITWVRGAAHPLGPGIGMAFEVRDAKEERRALELVLALLDESEHADRDAAANDAE